MDINFTVTSITPLLHHPPGIKNTVKPTTAQKVSFNSRRSVLLKPREIATFTSMPLKKTRSIVQPHHRVSVFLLKNKLCVVLSYILGVDEEKNRNKQGNNNRQEKKVWREEKKSSISLCIKSTILGGEAANAEG